MDQCRHYMAAIPILMPGNKTAPAEKADTPFEQYYLDRGRTVIGTVGQGDCGLDLMCIMLDMKQGPGARTLLRSQLGDYIRLHANKTWMWELMLACCELEPDDVAVLRDNYEAPRAINPRSTAPAEFESAVPPPLRATEVALPDNATAAIGWFIGCNDPSVQTAVLSQLPVGVIMDKVALYDARHTAPAAIEDRAPRQLRWPVDRGVYHEFRTRVCQRLQMFFTGTRTRRNAVPSFIATCIDTSRVPAADLAMIPNQIRQWFRRWRQRAPGDNTAPAVSTTLACKGYRTSGLCKAARSRNGVRRPRKCTRQNAPGGGRHPWQPMIRDALFEWWVGVRFAVDWTALRKRSARRGRGCSCRFPKSVLRWKVQQLVVEYAAAHVLHSEQKLTRLINTDSHWFRLFESEYGVSFKQANRRYEVAKHVQHRRIVLFWTSLFRVRQLCLLTFKYDPVLWIFDQTPYYQNETGAQRSPTLAVRGGQVPVVEGKSAAHSRWTACLSCCSSIDRIRERWPWAECMFKAADAGPKYTELLSSHRTSGYERWFSVAIAPRYTYRTCDVVAMSRRHIEEQHRRHRFEIVIADDFSAHRSSPVRDLVWAKGGSPMILGGGVTGAQQPCDIALNRHVRCSYGLLEATADADSADDDGEKLTGVGGVGDADDLMGSDPEDDDSHC